MVAFSSHCRTSSGAESVRSISFSRDPSRFGTNEIIQRNFILLENPPKSRSPVNHPLWATLISATRTPGKLPQQQPCTNRQQDQSEKYEFKGTHEEMIDQ
jgi:hypothetical protein